MPPRDTTGPGTPFSCHTHHDESTGAVRLALAGQLDVGTVAEVDRALDAAIARHPGWVIVDLRGLAYMDSTGLNLLLRTEARTRKAGLRFTIVQGGAALRRLFELTGADAYLPIVDDLAASPTAAPE